MATITKIGKLSVQQLSSNNWKLSVTYEANFSAQEVQQQFQYRDSFVVREDDNFNDDKLTGPLSVGTFKPSAQTVKRTLTTEIKGDTLNTEPGAEEIYVDIHLENLDLNVKFPTKSSNSISISP
ncbi:MAG TPA: hypothetical protein DCE56_05595 [Cyanobacteria bacterium UBA8553]|nr:hypothetical protein [Cyanobacteria bacterium UBA8553]HAJ62994.1 hypothetical protein [Cyanobacteria bacterium UBA8543]